jgi:hypothetical protein
MLKGNLATRPFYNDRLVSLTIGVIAAGVLALTAFNATQLYSLTRERSTFTKEIKVNDDQTRALRAKAAELTKTIDPSNMKMLHGNVSEANYLIDRRTFSWTAFLSIIERTLPLNVRLVEVKPKPEKNVMHVDITVNYKTLDDLMALVDAMEKTDLFRDVTPSARNPTDDGLNTGLIQAIYLAPMAEAPGPGRGGRKGRP